MDFDGIACEGARCVIAQGGAQWLPLANMIMNLWFAKKGGNFMLVS
jgi:hypothetical protein